MYTFIHLFQMRLQLFDICSISDVDWMIVILIKFNEPPPADNSIKLNFVE